MVSDIAYRLEVDVTGASTAGLSASGVNVGVLFFRECVGPVDVGEGALNTPPLVEIVDVLKAVGACGW